MRIREYGISVGCMPAGPLNKISDVPGVTVGHSTVISGRHQTGVSVIMPCPDDPFTHKLTAASYVLNGYGKTAGLVQIDELGTLESPVVLTNTLNVGLMFDAAVGYILDRCAAQGVHPVSVNPLVCECNDSKLNLITERAVGPRNFLEAVADAKADFAEGAVGGGRGMSCHGLKGGIGSSSRRVGFDGREFTVGILVMTNHGKLSDLVINGDPIGKRIAAVQASGTAPAAGGRASTGSAGAVCPSGNACSPAAEEPERGSCIVILATDLPLSERQLKRVLKRCPVGMARLGSFIGSGSGEVFVGFSTANRHDESDGRAVRTAEAFDDGHIDPVFRAAAEATEEAILNAMTAAEPVTGYTGLTRRSLAEYLGKV